MARRASSGVYAEVDRDLLAVKKKKVGGNPAVVRL